MIGALLTARSLRAFADGYVAVLLPVYLLALGFGTLEVDSARAAGWQTVGLGPTILRIETACLAGCAALLSALGGWDG